MPTNARTTASQLTFAPDSITRIELPDLGGGLTVVDDILWDATDPGLVRVDPATASVSEAIEGFTNTAFADGHLWAGGDFRMAELDPATGETLRDLELPSSELQPSYTTPG
ncbi:MAG: hypothetical protein ABIP53_08665 [Candidatus Limnocylindrales bacterium]